jgi:flagellar rod assembly protein/muramidase FlgJ
MTPENKKFIDSILAGAQEAHKKYGVFASVTLAQAALESAWGKTAISNNLFGIKADSSWKGKKVLIDTHEVHQGRRIPVKAWFRAYMSPNASVLDHALFLSQNPRYKESFKCNNGCDFARAIAKAGYATDPNYAELLISIIQHNGFDKYD